MATNNKKTEPEVKPEVEAKPDDVEVEDTTETTGNANVKDTSHQETQGNAQTLDTTESDTASQVEGQDPVGSQEDELELLGAFLRDQFPKEAGTAGLEGGEHPVRAAIRLIQGLSTRADGTTHPRCEQPYCNKPRGHADEHGMVVYAPDELVG